LGASVQMAAEIRRLHDSADKLVRLGWAQQRIEVIADA
jgi:hypothetical protein